MGGGPLYWSREVLEEKASLNVYAWPPVEGNTEPVPVTAG